MRRNENVTGFLTAAMVLMFVVCTDVLSVKPAFPALQQYAHRQSAD
ncbi:hypothetical protein NB643_03840 [Oxalobacter aliiformigenes]|nr:hypothetical protein [Oxalobacter aliiformigenes]WAV92604.1 hypothetical protein NB641_07275 [Oxalobacter aliiformigenes]WAV95888.1 hypothetical protein NB643_03840 [Oxalobacter aliiformigenes]